MKFLSQLAALGGCEPQLAGHVAANRNVGNDRGRLLDVLTQLLPYIGYPRTLNAYASSTRSRPPRRENPRDVPDLAHHRSQQRLRPPALAHAAVAVIPGHARPVRRRRPARHDGSGH